MAFRIEYTRKMPAGCCVCKNSSRIWSFILSLSFSKEKCTFASKEGVKCTPTKAKIIFFRLLSVDFHQKTMMNHRCRPQKKSNTWISAKRSFTRSASLTSNGCSSNFHTLLQTYQASSSMLFTFTFFTSLGLPIRSDDSFRGTLSVCFVWLPPSMSNNLKFSGEKHFMRKWIEKLKDVCKRCLLGLFNFAEFLTQKRLNADYSVCQFGRWASMCF